MATGTTQQYPQTGMLPVTEKYAQLNPDEFRTSLSETWQASKAILDMVADQVEASLITPVEGARVTAAITGSLFGFQEFHRELSPSDLAWLTAQQQRPGNGS